MDIDNDACGTVFIEHALVAIRYAGRGNKSVDE
jgi:hypothetical protein